jgi:hypothetical protein
MRALEWADAQRWTIRSIWFEGPQVTATKVEQGSGIEAETDMVVSERLYQSLLADEALKTEPQETVTIPEGYLLNLIPGSDTPHH